MVTVFHQALTRVAIHGSFCPILVVYVGYLIITCALKKSPTSTMSGLSRMHKEENATAATIGRAVDERK